MILKKRFVAGKKVLSMCKKKMNDYNHFINNLALTHIHTDNFFSQERSSRVARRGGFNVQEMISQ